MAESFGVLPIYSRGGKGDLAADSDDRFTREVRAIRPRLTVILIGTNDLGNQRTLPATLQHVDGMLRQVEGHAIVCGLLPAGGKFATNHKPADLIAWNAALKALAEAHGDRFIDFFPNLLDSTSELRSSLTLDGLHPNLDGYGLMTTKLLPLLTDAFLRNP